MLALNSIRELRLRPLRTLLTLGGVTVATAMLSDMLMLGGGIQRSFSEVLESVGYELRLSPRGTLPFDTEASIRGIAGLRDTVESVAGVQDLVPVLAQTLTIMADGDESPGPRASRQTLALGLDTDEEGLYTLLTGRSPGDGEILIDPALAALLDTRPGDRLRLGVSSRFGTWGGDATAVVSGTAEFIFATRRDMPVALPLADLQPLSARTDQASFAMIRLREGHAPGSVREAITAATDRVEVVTLAGIAEQVDERLSYFRQLAAILASVSLLVAALLIGTISAVSVSDQLGVIAALRAIGVSRRRIVGDLTAESAVLCGVGGGLGIALSIAVAHYLESILADFPGLPATVRFFVLSPGTLAAAYGLVVAAGVVAGLLPALRATWLEVTTLLHREEP